MTIEVVSFNIPYPPNYGGVIDVYHKLAALKKLGVNVILHAFQYNRQPAKELEQICDKVYYYRRDTSLIKQFSALPYIVVSRKNDELYRRLSSTDNPVLMEGIHTTYYLEKLVKQGKKVIVRTHNVEANYYYHLSKGAENPVKRLYYRIEALKLKKYEKVLRYATVVAAISETDKNFFSCINENTVLLPAFSGLTEVKSKAGKGEYILFHGNLSVDENIKAVTWLTENVFAKVNAKVIVAGLNPPASLEKLLQKYPNVTLKKNLPQREMEDLIANAHINILYTFQNTGIKLKLLNSLYNGRFCVANSLMVDCTGLEDLCHIANTSEEYVYTINGLMNKTFDEVEVQKRKEVLSGVFNNEKALEELLEMVK